VVKVLLLQQQQVEFGIKRFHCFIAEFDKLGLRVGEKHILEVLKADQILGKTQCS
jgi:hypothetical protein